MLQKVNKELKYNYLLQYILYCHFYTDNLKFVYVAKGSITHKVQTPPLPKQCCDMMDARRTCTSVCNYAAAIFTSLFRAVIQWLAQYRLDTIKILFQVIYCTNGGHFLARMTYREKC